MRSKKALLLSAALVFLLAICLVGCSYDTKVTDAYQEGYDQGYQAGYDKGYADGSAITPGNHGNQDGTKPTPSGTISWDEAINHVGEVATVCGPVAGTYWASSSNGKPTFLNVGKDYPSSDRFVVLIWEEYRDNFPQPPETYYLGKTICVEGLIQEYEGVAEIEVTSSGQIQEH